MYRPPFEPGPYVTCVFIAVVVIAIASAFCKL